MGIGAGVGDVGVITVVGSITTISPPSVPVPVVGSITGSVVGFVVGSVVGAVVVVCPVCGPDVMSVPVWGLTEGCGSGSVRFPELPSTTGDGSGVGFGPTDLRCHVPRSTLLPIFGRFLRCNCLGWRGQDRFPRATAAATACRDKWDQCHRAQRRCLIRLSQGKNPPR